MADIVLHHYNPSPYSEKVRLMLGYKGLAWKSVKTPSMLPKPQLQALTGGYRGAPVMQIGADVYCDSALIAAELEARYPAPALFAPGSTPWTSLVAGWADSWLFWKTVRLAMGINADALPEAFVEDRAAMRGGDDMFAPASTKADLPHSRSQFTLALDALEHQLAGRDHLGGSKPSYDDFAVYHNLWFAVRAERALIGEAHPRLAAWMQRIALIGQGAREEIDAAQALAIAREATALPIHGGSPRVPDASGIALGEPVRVRPESFGTEETTGIVVALDRSRIVLSRESADVGTVHVHFPRLGYRIGRAH
jgi:glutathione S-transferase